MGIETQESSNTSADGGSEKIDEGLERPSSPALLRSVAAKVICSGYVRPVGSSETAASIYVGQTDAGSAAGGNSRLLSGSPAFALSQDDRCTTSSVFVETRELEIQYMDTVHWLQKKIPTQRRTEMDICIATSGSKIQKGLSGFGLSETSSNGEINVNDKLQNGIDSEKGLVNGFIKETKEALDLCIKSSVIQRTTHDDSTQDAIKGDIPANATTELASKTNSLKRDKATNKLAASLDESSEELVAGVQRTVAVRLLKGNTAVEDKDTLWVQVSDVDTGKELLKNTTVRYDGSVLNFKIRPICTGTIRVCVKPGVSSRLAELGSCSLDIPVHGNNPVCSFNEASFWPVATAADDFRKILYVAYGQHISVFDYSGNFVRGLVDLEQGFYYDLALCYRGRTLVASVSGFISQGKTKSRYQEVHVYDVTTRITKVLHIIGRERPHLRFSNPVLPITCKKNDVIIADANSLYVVSAMEGVMQERIRIKDLGSVSRIAHAQHQYIVTDGATGEVKIYTEGGHLVHSFAIHDTETNTSVEGLMGLSVDRHFNIILSDCLSGLLRVYSKCGELIGVLTSDWDAVKWPVHISVDKYGYIYVADHGNMCVKKFAYL